MVSPVATIAVKFIGAEQSRAGLGRDWGEGRIGGDSDEREDSVLCARFILELRCTVACPVTLSSVHPGLLKDRWYCYNLDLKCSLKAKGMVVTPMALLTDCRMFRHGAHLGETAYQRANWDQSSVLSVPLLCGHPEGSSLFYHTVTPSWYSASSK